MKIRPLHDRVIVKRLDEEKKTAVEAEQRFDGFVGDLVEQSRRPAERRRSEAQRADGVASVVLQ